MALYIWPATAVSITGVATEATLLDIKSNTDTLVTDVGVIKAAMPGSLLKGIIFDYVGCDDSGATTDVYTYLEGGSGGTLKRTITITYTDATKAHTASVAAVDPGA
jgi:hypothetical protein